MGFGTVELALLDLATLLSMVIGWGTP